MPAGAVECDLLCLLLILGAVGEDEAVCWWGWVAPCDIHTRGCQLGEMELCDGPDPCKTERGHANPTVCRSPPPCCSQHFYGKYPRKMAKLELWALQRSETGLGSKNRMRRGKQCFPHLCQQTLFIPDTHGG